jgi:hypothetical protein
MVAKSIYQKPAIMSTLTEQEVFGSESLTASAWGNQWKNSWTNGGQENRNPY